MVQRARRVERAQHGLTIFFTVFTLLASVIVAFKKRGLLQSDGAAGARAHALEPAQGLSPLDLSRASLGPSSSVPVVIVGAASTLWNAEDGATCSDTPRRRLVNGPSPAPVGSECNVKTAACEAFLSQAFGADPNAGGCCPIALLTPSDIATTCSLLTQGCSSTCYSAPAATSVGTFEAKTAANTVLDEADKHWIANQWKTMIQSIISMCALTANVDICPTPLVFIGLPLHAELAWDTFILAHWSPNQEGTCPMNASIPVFSGAVCTSTGRRQQTMLPQFLSLAGSWFKAASDYYDLSNPTHIGRMVAHRRIPVVIDLLPAIFSTQFERAAFSALILKISNDFVRAVFKKQNVVSSMVVGTPARRSVTQSPSFAAYVSMRHPLVVDLVSSTAQNSSATAELSAGLKRAMSTYACNAATCLFGDGVVFCGHPSAVYYPRMALISKLRDVASDVFTYMMIAP